MKTFVKHLIIILIFCFNTFAFSQEFSFAILTDTHIGYNNSHDELDSLVNLINSDNSISFTLHTGDITEKGKNSELEKAAEILSKLNNDCFVIPGNHDTKWSESGTLKIFELWKDNKFFFEKNGYLFIGLNSGILWRGGGGHIATEDINWIKKKIKNIDSNTPIFLFLHHPLEDIDNNFQLINSFIGYNLSAIFFGHYHTNRIDNYYGIPTIYNRAAISKNIGYPSYTKVTVSNNNLKLSDSDSLNGYLQKGEITLNKVNFELKDSSDFKLYDANLIWKYDLNQTLVRTPAYKNGKIIAADYSGIVTCLDTSGNFMWDFDVFGNVVAAPSICDNFAVVGTLQGDLFTLNIEDGSNYQSLGFDEYITSQLNIIDYTGSKKLMIPKKTDSKKAVLVGTGSGKIYLHDLETLEQIWINDEPKGMIETLPLVDENKIYFGAWDGNFYSIDAETGWLIWKWKENGNFYYSPAAVIPKIIKRNLYLTTPEKFTYAIDKLLGKTNWKTSSGAWESVGISSESNLVFVKSLENYLYVLNAKNGVIRNKINLEYGIDTNPNEIIEWNGNILFGSKNGIFYQIDKKKKIHKLVFLGFSRTNNIKHLTENKFLISNMDGRIAIIELKQY